MKQWLVQLKAQYSVFTFNTSKKLKPKCGLQDSGWRTQLFPVDKVSLCRRQSLKVWGSLQLWLLLLLQPGEQLRCVVGDDDVSACRWHRQRYCTELIRKKNKISVIILPLPAAAALRLGTQTSFSSFMLVWTDRLHLNFWSGCRTWAPLVTDEGTPSPILPPICCETLKPSLFLSFNCLYINTFICSLIWSYSSSFTSDMLFYLENFHFIWVRLFFSSEMFFPLQYSLEIIFPHIVIGRYGHALVSIHAFKKHAVQ